MNILISYINYYKLHYPLAPEKLAVSSDMLSKCCKKFADKYEIKVGDVKTLISNLGNKTNYVVHYRYLQLYLSLGMKLTKIHRVLKSKQSDWMKKYVDFNSDFFNFFKLMIIFCLWKNNGKFTKKDQCEISKQ